MSVSLIGSDAVRERAIGYITDSMQQLIELSDRIFSQFAERLEICNDRLKQVGGHIDRVQKKLDAVSRMNTAIVIYSPAKFPSRVYERLNAVFNMEDSKELAKDLVFDYTSTYQPPLRIANLDIKNVVAEKSKFYHVGIKKANNEEGNVIPSTIESVADIFLFNTSVNVFTQKEYVDPLDNTVPKFRPSPRTEVITRSKGQNSEEDSALTVSVKEKADPFQYEPELGILQDFDFPDILPDLPGIASDMMFSDPQFVPIAPSAQAELTSEVASAISKTQEDFSAAVTAPVRANAEHIVLSSNIALTPKLDKNSSQFVEKTSEINQPSLNETILPSAPPAPPSLPPPPLPPPPPPPPPPPSHPSSFPTDSTAKVPKVTNSGMSAMDDGRSSLMEAIRRAGGTKGANLRSVRKKSTESNDDVSALPKRSILPPGDDLMTSLSKALEMRRRGISGRKQEKKSKLRGHVGEGALAHISAMIPPPPKSEERLRTQELDGDDDDWGL